MFRVAGFCLSFLLAWSAIGTASDERVDALPENHRKWIEEEVVYIISAVEREAFLGLEAETDRESFVTAFWRKRDTNPSTPENEYQEEHQSRLDYVNKFFGRDTFRNGWQTDMGRYYIILGPPRGRQNFEAKGEIYPTELWFYNDAALKNLGLPPFFYLLFFRRHGNGEMELYSPIADGPQTLLTGYQAPPSMDFRDDIERAYDQLWEITPELAHASLSFRTDEGDRAQFSNPSFGTLSLMDQIVNSPMRGVDTSYAEFDGERGLVESDYLFAFVPTFGMMNVLPGPGNTHFIHWTIEFDPQHIAFINDENGRYTTMFIVSVEVVSRENPDLVVLEYRKESFVNLNRSDGEIATHAPLAYSGMWPIIPGSYEVRVVIRNRACPSREERRCVKSYSLLQAPVDIPEWETASPWLSDLVLAYGTKRNDEPLYRPYRFGSLELLANPRRVFPIGESVVVSTDALNAESGSQIQFRIIDREDPGPAVLEKSVTVDGFRSEPFVQEFQLAGFTGGRYQVVADLMSPEGIVLDTKRANFDVSPRSRVARPYVRGTLPNVLPEIPGAVQMALGEQYLNIENKTRARELFEATVEANPMLGLARESLAGLAMEAGDTTRVRALLEPVYEKVQDRFEVVAVLGEAYARDREFSKAAELLEKAVLLRRPNTRLLNFLAVSQVETGNLPRAQEVLERSLALDPEQPEIKELMEKVKASQKVPTNPFSSGRCGAPPI